MQDFLQTLNRPQREAVLHTEGPLLILAGAGSGKTRVLTCRTAYLLQEKHVPPWNIMAITFTNKAASEMRARVDAMAGEDARFVWVSTFHATCCRMLRRFIDHIGYDKSFTIYDTDDTKQVMKEVIRGLGLNPKVYKERALLTQVSHEKEALRTYKDTEAAARFPAEQTLAAVYRAYEQRLRKNNALDFDDLLVLTVRLFREDPQVLAFYQDRFRYIMIDEYQDTNSAQFAFVQLLAGREGNLCVVGDDDQSIYKFRGADVRNILEFEQAFPGAHVVRLEQNYRSTQNILDAANAVIAHNRSRKEKKLWTDQGAGGKLRFRQFQNGYEEAEFVAEDIAQRVHASGAGYASFAVLYRTNAMSRLFEEKFVAANIPYKLVGGVNFYARREIKDLLAYLKTVDNGLDDLACARIINVPRRGIGETTVAHVQQYAAEKGLSFFEALNQVHDIPEVRRAAAKIHSFTKQIGKYRGMLQEDFRIQQVLAAILEDTGYLHELEAEGTDEAQARIENINELISKVADYEAAAASPSLTEFLQQVSLVADIDTVEEGSDYVLLMTLHSAKGLEFDQVYMVGMEDNTFPSYMALSMGDDTDLEEERRLCYVGITRARQELTLTAARTRMVRGQMTAFKVSRFVREIPRELVELDRETTDTRRFLSPPRDPFADALGRGAGMWDDGVSFGRAGSDTRRRAAPGDAPDWGDAHGSAAGEAPTALPNRFGLSGLGSAGYTNPGAGGRPKTKGAFGSNLAQFRVQKLTKLSYEVGDTVRHVKFGLGRVLDIQQGAKDFEVKVDFQQHGVKRMFASFAKLEKVEQ